MTISPSLIDFCFARCFKALREYYGPDKNDVTDPDMVERGITRDILAVLEQGFGGRRLHEDWRQRKIQNGSYTPGLNSAQRPWLYIPEKDKKGFAMFVDTVWSAKEDWQRLEAKRLKQQAEDKLRLDSARAAQDKIDREQKVKDLAKQREKQLERARSVTEIRSLVRMLGVSPQALNAGKETLRGAGISPGLLDDLVPNDVQDQKAAAQELILSLRNGKEGASQEKKAVEAAVPLLDSQLDSQRIQYCTDVATKTVDAYLLAMDPNRPVYNRFSDIDLKFRKNMASLVLKASPSIPTFAEMLKAEKGRTDEPPAAVLTGDVPLKVGPAYNIFAHAVQGASRDFDTKHKGKEADVRPKYLNLRGDLVSQRPVREPVPPRGHVNVKPDGSVDISELGTPCKGDVVRADFHDFMGRPTGRKEFYYAESYFRPDMVRTNYRWTKFSDLRLDSLNELNRKLFAEAHRSESSKEALTYVLRELEKRTGIEAKPGRDAVQEKKLNDVYGRETKTLEQENVDRQYSLDALSDPPQGQPFKHD